MVVAGNVLNICSASILGNHIVSKGVTVVVGCCYYTSFFYSLIGWKRDAARRPCCSYKLRRRYQKEWIDILLCTLRVLVVVTRVVWFRLGRHCHAHKLGRINVHYPINVTLHWSLWSSNASIDNKKGQRNFTMRLLVTFHPTDAKFYRLFSIR